jgi:hypothetical protein
VTKSGIGGDGFEGMELVMGWNFREKNRHVTETEQYFGFLHTCTTQQQYGFEATVKWLCKRFRAVIEPRKSSA